MTPREILESLGSDEYVNIEIGGHPFRIRTSLRVEDAIAFNRVASAMSVQGQSMVLFQLLAYTPNGIKVFREGEDDEWFMSVDMASIFKPMLESGALKKILSQFNAGGEEDGDDEQGKSDS